jgi:oxaloacetate decarboxylase gamma subunit
LTGMTQVEQGLDLMLYGMGTVFLFLTLLVIVTALMSIVVTRWLPDDDHPLTPSESNLGVDGRVLAVIEAALAKHRCRHK